MEVEASFWNQDGAATWFLRDAMNGRGLHQNNFTNLQKLEVGAMSSLHSSSLLHKTDKYLISKIETLFIFYLSVYPSICLFLSIQPASRPSSHPCNACSSIQFNAGRFNSIRCASIRFNVFNNAMQILLHFISCHFNSIKCLHPTRCQKHLQIYTCQTFRASCDFPCLS